MDTATTQTLEFLPTSQWAMQKWFQMDFVVMAIMITA